MAMWAALLLAPLQIVLGDRQGLNTAHYQPAKLAAMEGLWDTERNVPATLFAWPDMAAEKNLYEISVPHLASLYLTHSWDGEVQGLKATPPENRPYVPLVFFAFRIMVGIGMLLLGPRLPARCCAGGDGCTTPAGSIPRSPRHRLVSSRCLPAGPSRKLDANPSLSTGYCARLMRPLRFRPAQSPPR